MIVKIKFAYFFLGAVMVLFLADCTRDKRAPGREYMADMAHSLAYETYSVSQNYDDGMSARLPVDGTISRGSLPNDTTNSLEYLYKHYSENSEEDYQRAGERLTNPIVRTGQVLEEGKRVFTIHCAICHGETGLGNGYIVETEKFPAVPTSYYIERLMDMPMGQMYHVLEYGRNMMGSYSSQLTIEERWSVLHYVKKLQEDYAETSGGADESAEAIGDITETKN